MEADIAFPVLNFSYGEKHIEVVENSDNLETCSSVAMKKGYFEKLLIVDSKGKLFSVKDVKKRSYAGPFWGFSLLYNRKLKVKLDLAEPVQLTLDDFKDRVCNVIDSDANFWSANADPKDIKADIRKAKTFKEVIQRLQCL